ncbi:uncharacterized protein K452DRAFT_361490 [Aplosporella prunicola CBS 121167]|uniref:Protein ROT1 n=1 Tax=Aplosporella prunicola CBS 121167 TaxID=1176127 RepID=A0A6A6B422_9PEZI|nr:uncharacterized protein K452DRAFT_361490 [Aplosporella prunicola CBS 121167]KAF2138005.1 hypothetical protein K452DRAFT_361490 [Aplosporella prunicola CBS 121167]
MLVAALLAATATLATAQGIADAQLYGTWSSKSNKTLTGPGFYDPVNDKIIEPALPGISYSFTSDGHYEEAHYRALANPVDPACPKGLIQWQHGTFEKTAAGELKLSPIADDGRQLLSDPCKFDAGVYTRYSKNETFKSYTIAPDAFHDLPRLDLHKADGAPLIPLYLAFSPAQMLPTTTLNPTAKATGAAKLKRSAEEALAPLKRRLAQKPQHIDADRWWWFGVGMTGVGSLLYFCF